ncbi:MAG: peptidoglycan DD-metalloendopeptidase family protein [Bacilli bacterium]
MKYKSIDKYLNKNKRKGSSKGFLYKFVIRVFICIVLVLGLLIFLKFDKNNKQIIYKYLYENNINFATINNWYQEHFGDILPFQNIVKDNTKLVFNENLVYEDASVYKDGVKLKVDSNYLVPIIESGIVVFIGEKDDYGKTVIVQQVDGVNVWYGNIDNINVSLYDYVSKGELLAEANNSFYMVFQKKGKYIKYQDYLK